MKDKLERLVRHFRARCRKCGDLMDWGAYADEVEAVRKTVTAGRKVCVVCETANACSIIEERGFIETVERIVDGCHGMKLSDVKFLKAKAKDYEGRKLLTRPLQNYPEWDVWADRHWGPGALPGMMELTRLILGDNREKFKRHFGKCAFVYRGSDYFHCWLADLGGAHLLVMTAREHGTCYELVERIGGAAVPADIGKVLAFLDIVAKLDENQKETS